MLLNTYQKWHYLSIMNTHFFYRYTVSGILGGLIWPMLEVTSYLKLD